MSLSLRLEIGAQRRPSAIRKSSGTAAAQFLPVIGRSLVFTTKSGRRRGFLPALVLLLAVTPPCCVRAQDKTSDLFMQAVAARFYAWDLDHNQALSMAELDVAIKDPANTGRPAAALAALKRASLSTDCTLPPLTFNNIRELVSRPPAKHQPNLARLYLEGLRRINSLTKGQLFASSLPRLETIRQGRIGDCFCLAPIGAMVHRDPHEVASMFSMAGDYHCVVRIGPASVVVAVPTDAERATGKLANNGQDGLWVNLYEEAMGQLHNSLKLPDQQSYSPIEAIADGGSAGKIISFLTGHKVSGFSLGFGKNSTAPAALIDTRLASLRRKLADATGQKRLVTCSTERPATPGLTPRHVYALLAYDPINDTIDLWNPHGNDFTPKGLPGLTNGYPTRNGLFTMPVPEFVQLFSGMAFEDPELAARSLAFH